MTEKFSCRCVSIAGAVTSAIGLVLSSFANKIIIYYFTYGLLFGIGSSCVRTSNFLVVAKYFDKRRPFATGILTSGAGLGLFVLAPVTRTFLDNFSLENTLRFLAGIAFVGGIPALAYDPHVEQDNPTNSDSQVEGDGSRSVRKAKIIVDCSVWTVPAFTVFAMALVMDRFGGSITRLHLVKYSEEQGVSSDNSARLLMFYGLSSCIARLLAGRVCDLTWVNPHYVFQVGNFIAALSIILAPLARSYSHFLVCGLFFGVGAGISISTSNLIFLTCVDERRRASAFGLASCLASFSILLAPPLAGFLADTLESYAPSFYLAGGVLLLCAVFPFVLLCVKAKNESDGSDQEMIAVEEDEQIQIVTVC